MNKSPVINNSRKIYSTYNYLSSCGFSDDVISNNLLNFLAKGELSKDLTFTALLSDFYSTAKHNYIDLVELIGLVHQKSKEKISISDTDARKHNGIYYTNYSIARHIARDVLSLFDKDFNPTKNTFLEPCSGTGIFAIAYLDEIFETDSKYLKKAQGIINNMYYADIDESAINLLKKILPAYLKAKYKININIPNNNVFIGDVLFELNGTNLIKNNLKDKFNRLEGFDIVITNPPYKLLKASSNKYKKGTNYKEQVSEILKLIRKNKSYKLNRGTLNLYKLFVEEILENYTNNNGKIGLLIPSTLLSDKQSYELRNRILEKYSISTIYCIPENNNFFLDISQAFCFFALDKSKSSNDINVKNNIFDVSELDKKSILVSKNRINSVSTMKEIVSTDDKGWKILDKIHRFKKLKEIPAITNLRGELDLTLDKRYLTSVTTKYKLLRGNGVKEFSFIGDRLFVHGDFIKKLNGKAGYILSDRLVCQQVSNVSLNKRLKFSKIPKNIVLGNSCNFIATNSDSLFVESHISLDYLLGILNSLLLNWRFQLTSSNNHIGNYELNELPVAIPSTNQKNVIEDLALKLISEPDNDNYKVKLNIIVFDLYGLNKDESLYILDHHKDTKVAKLTRNYFKS